MACIINCRQINLQHSRAASTELAIFDDEIVLITEPLTYGRKIQMLSKPRFQVLAHEGQDRPRAAVRVAGKLHPWLVDEFTIEDVYVRTLWLL